MNNPHPLGSKARVLLTSVYGPYACDDADGSRAINPMELYHNQVTRTQGPFSLRMFHRSWGLMLLQANMKAPCMLLDFPTKDRFIQELQNQDYDIIGISSIVPNVGKVEVMCRLIRKYQPNATIVVGGHVANVPNLASRIDADHIVRGEGVAWFRAYLGEEVHAPIKHPRIVSGIGARTMGMSLSAKPGDVAATLIPSVGCPIGCNFCATSAMFGGKGKFINFFETGDELFEVMEGLERDMKVHSFFVMDENFLLHRKRALRLLELMIANKKAWSLYVFSSARVIQSYTIEQLVGLGVSWVWMGLEGKESSYAKLSGADTPTLVRTLQSHGIHVLGSSIIGLEEHRPENISEVIDHAVGHNTEFHQFMLYTPLPGTLLFAEHKANGSLLDPDCLETADNHGQLKFSHRHPHIPAGMETQFLLDAFNRDFETNGPSVVRMAGTKIQGWKRYKNHSDERLRIRYAREGSELVTVYAGALWAAGKWFKNNLDLSEKIKNLLRDIHREFGFKSRLLAPAVGRFIRFKLKREQWRLKSGWTYEPPTFFDKNEACAFIPG